MLRFNLLVDYPLEEEDSSREYWLLDIIINFLKLKMKRKRRKRKIVRQVFVCYRKKKKRKRASLFHIMVVYVYRKIN